MAASFDPVALGMSAAEAMLMDPQQRLLLEVFAESLGSSASGTGGPGLTGVYVGISSMDYQKLATRYVAGVTAYSATGAHGHKMPPAWLLCTTCMLSHVILPAFMATLMLGTASW